MTTMLQLVALGYAYAGSAAIFEDVSAHLIEGWTALVGANGEGKTTLMRLLAGELAPTQGQVRHHAPGARVALCPQRVEALDEAIQAFGWCWDADAMRLRSVLGLEPEALERWEVLSPGERKRWQIGAALAEQPAILLLDEPTNHLDASARQRLLEALAGFDGAGLLISHDRGLMDVLCQQTWRMAGGRLTSYPGGYTAARVLWEQAQRDALARRDALRAERKAVERRLQSARERRQSAEGQISHGARMKDVHDHDARTMGAKVLAQWAEAGAGRGVEVTRRALERAEEAEQAAFVAKEVGGAIAIQAERCPRPVLVSWDGPLVAGGQVLSPGVTLHLERDARLWVSGDNGAGKSTLLGALLARCDLDPARVLYVPQELTQEAEAALVAEILAAAPDRRGRIFQVAAALGLEAEHVLRSQSAPSPGMARKLMIARGLVDAVWMLVLDEPTNHLDAPSIDRLEAALRTYTGALVLVSHDEALARACTTSRLHILRGAFSSAQVYATNEA